MERPRSGLGLRTTLLLLALLPSCRKSGKEQEKDLPRRTAGVRKPEHASKGGETIRQKSYRLFPILEQGGLPDWTAPPLLVPDPALKLGGRLILREPGANRTPSPRDLAKFEALGKPLPEILARNLRLMLPNTEIRAIGKPGGARFLFIDTSLFGIESLVLLPDFWDLCSETLGGEVLMALPDRSMFTVFRERDQALLEGFAPRYRKLHKNGADPLLPCFLARKEGRLQAGLSFEALEHEKKK